jgi:hypothetical protein
MKKILLLPLLFFAFSLAAQQVEGAWKLVSQNQVPVTGQEFIKIYQDNYFAFGVKNLADNSFVGAGGGPFSMTSGKLQETLEFFTLNPEIVGMVTSFEVSLQGNRLTVSGTTPKGPLVETWERLSDSKDDLTGNWVITGRKREDQLQRSTPGARRTIKILSGWPSTPKLGSFRAREEEPTARREENTWKPSPFSQETILAWAQALALTTRSSMENGTTVA